MNIYKYKTDAMRAVLRYTSQHGYRHYTAGTCPAEKFPNLIKKFNENYGILMTSQQKYRAKKKNRAISVLIAWKAGSQVEWILMASAGEGLVYEKEELLDLTIRTQRLEITGYELVQLSRRGAEPSWTYRMTYRTKHTYLEQVKTAVRRQKQHEIDKLIHSIKGIPAFRGVRKDAYAIINRGVGEWVRIMPKDAVNPFKSIWVGWIGRYLPAETIKPTKLTAKKGKGEPKP